MRLSLAPDSQPAETRCFGTDAHQDARLTLEPARETGEPQQHMFRRQTERRMRYW